MRTRSNVASYGSDYGPGKPGRTRIISNSSATGSPPGTVIADFNPDNYPLLDLGQKDETISDEIGPSGRFKAVTHVACDFSRLACPTPTMVSEASHWVQSSTAGSNTWYNGARTVGVTGPWRAEYAHCTYGKTEQQLVNEAAHKFFSENAADNLQNIIEAEQTARGLQSCLGILQKILHVLQADTKDIMIKRLFGRGWMRKSLRTLSGQYLAYRFGFAPLASDLKTTADGLRHLRRKLQELANKKEVIVATRKQVGNYSDPFAGTLGCALAEPSTPNSTYWHPRDFSEAPLRVVGVRGTKTRQFLTSGFVAGDYLLKTFVSPGPVSLAWELVPFSFVLDWFLDLTPVLDAWDQTLVGVDRKIDYVWISEKRVIRYDMIRHLCSNEIGKDGERFVDPYIGGSIGYCSSKYYRRLLTDLRPSVELSHRFGKRQGVETGALLIQTCANLKLFDKR